MVNSAVSGDTNQKRIEMASELRRSHINVGPSVPSISTNHDTYKTGGSIGDMKQLLEEKRMIVEKVRGAKPNFTLGRDQTNYESQQASSLITPCRKSYNRADPQGVANA